MRSFLQAQFSARNRTIGVYIEIGVSVEPGSAQIGYLSIPCRDTVANGTTIETALIEHLSTSGTAGLNPRLPDMLSIDSSQTQPLYHEVKLGISQMDSVVAVGPGTGSAGVEQ